MLFKFVIAATIHILITVTIVLVNIVFAINVEVMAGMIVREKHARRSKSNEGLTKVSTIKL